MSWVRLDDAYAMHPKVVQAGNGAVGLHVRAISWCAQQLTDGFLPNAAARLLGSEAEIAALVETRLFDAVDGGYQVHDFLDFNPSRESLTSRRERERERRRQGRREHSVAGAQVTDAEHALAGEIIDAFNDAAGSSYTADAHLTKLVGRIREHPELGADDHCRIINANFSCPWWSDRPGPQVIYGSRAQFERSIEAAKGPPRHANGNRADVAERRIQSALRAATA